MNTAAFKILLSNLSFQSHKLKL